MFEVKSRLSVAFSSVSISLIILVGLIDYLPSGRNRAASSDPDRIYANPAVLPN